MDDKALTEQTEHAAELAANWTKILERSQEVWRRFAEAHANDEHPLHADPLNAVPAFAELSQTLMNHPKEVAERTLQFWLEQTELWRRASMKWMGVEDEGPVIEPAKGDKRFAHDEWSENHVFDYVKQSYLLTSRWIQDTVHSVGDLDERDRRKVDFYTRAIVEAMSPTNFAATNPEVLHATLEEKGENLVRGLDNMLRDLDRGKGKLLIRQTDMDAFTVGENMALTPGKVIFQNEVMQLIQYAPTTEQVYAKPLVFIPPWINKFYILDLNEKKSMVKWLVGQGYTVFMISWINPDERQKDETWESYMTKGAFTAIDVALKECGQDNLNVASYCIGGTLCGTMLAYMAATGDTRVNSATFFTAQLEFSDAGELQVFVDDMTVEVVNKQMEKGYLDASQMANAFNLLRSSDLIWGYVINNYMLGKDPFPFDLLYWNADSTCMPAKVHYFYLDRFYNANALASGEMKLNGKTVDLADVRLPLYHLAAKEDHIAPAASVYRGAKLLKNAKNRYVLAGSGHIAGVVNPPEANKYQHWVRNDAKAPDLETWLEQAKEVPGSWWPDWDKWLSKLSGKKVPAREPGAVAGVIEDAPGSYVKVRHDER